MTTDEAKNVLNLLALAFPQAEITTPTAQVWVEHLRDIAFDHGIEAAQQIVATKKWFPTIASFRERALALCLRSKRDERRAIDRNAYFLFGNLELPDGQRRTVHAVPVTVPPERQDAANREAIRAMRKAHTTGGDR